MSGGRRALVLLSAGVIAALIACARGSNRENDNTAVTGDAARDVLTKAAHSDSTAARTSSQPAAPSREAFPLVAAVDFLFFCGLIITLHRLLSPEGVQTSLVLAILYLLTAALVWVLGGVGSGVYRQPSSRSLEVTARYSVLCLALVAAEFLLDDRSLWHPFPPLLGVGRVSMILILASYLLGLVAISEIVAALLEGRAGMNRRKAATWLLGMTACLAAILYLFDNAAPMRSYADNASALNVYARNVPDLRVSFEFPTDIWLEGGEANGRSYGSDDVGPYVYLQLSSSKPGFEYAVSSHGDNELLPIALSGQKVLRGSSADAPITTCGKTGNHWITGYAEGGSAQVVFQAREGFTLNSGDRNVVVPPTIEVPSITSALIPRGSCRLMRPAGLWTIPRGSIDGWANAVRGATIVPVSEEAEVNPDIRWQVSRPWTGDAPQVSLDTPGARADASAGAMLRVRTEYSYTSPATQRRSQFLNLMSAVLVGVAASALFQYPTRSRRSA